MTPEQFEQLLAIGEPGGVEFKSGLPLTRPRPFKVIQAVLGLANRRGGGHVLLGVAEGPDGTPDPVGVAEDDLVTWTQDAAVDVFAEYGEPRPLVTLEKFQHDGAWIVCLKIEEFDTQPVLCKKDSDGVLRRGALYVRPRARAQTVENGSMEDMRELLDLATQKRVAHFLRLSQRAGVDLTLSGDDPYDAELGDF